jgi:hypothetical protein
MKQTLSTTVAIIASVLNYEFALAGNVAPSRGITTCRAGQDCSWRAGRAELGATEKNSDHIKTSQSAQSDPKSTKNNKPKLLSESFVSWEASSQVKPCPILKKQSAKRPAFSL